MPLSSDEVKKVEIYCHAVYDYSRKVGSVQRKQDVKRSGREINLQGLAAEFWFKNKYNLPYSLDITMDSVKPRSYKKDIDVKIDDLVLEIKQTTYDRGCLFMPNIDWHGKHRDLLADVYVLVVGRFPDYNKDLFITRDKFIKLNSNKKDELTPRIHKRIGKVGYFCEQSDMYTTLEEALKWVTL